MAKRGVNMTAAEQTIDTAAAPAAVAETPTTTVVETPVVEALKKSTQQRFEELFAKITNRSPITVDELEEFANLSKQVVEINGKFEEKANELKAVIKEWGFKPEDLFDNIKVATSSGKKSIDTDKRPSNKNDILINFKGNVGKEFNYHKGRVWEDKQDGTIAVTDPFKAYLTVPRFFTKTEEEITKCLTSEGKAYFATEEGKAEFKALISLNEQAKTDAAKADAKAAEKKANDLKKKAAAVAPVAAA